MNRAGEDDGPPVGPEPLAEWRPEDAELLRGLFLEEADEHVRQVQAAEQGLLDQLNEETPPPPHLIDGLFRHLHTLKGAAGSVGFHAVATTAHDLEGICADIRSGELAVTPGTVERLDEGIATLRALLDGARLPASRLPSSPHLFAPHQGAEGISRDARSGHVPRLGDRRLLADRRLVAGRPAAGRLGADRTVRVEPERLDALLDGLGDLVILRTRIERRVLELEGTLRDLSTARSGLRTVVAAMTVPGAHRPMSFLDRLGDAELAFAETISHLDRSTKALGGETESLRRTTDELEDDLRQARLVPLDWVFARLSAALPQLEQVASRQAELLIEGGEIEIDKAVAEHLHEPLLHLLRNAMAHGIEVPEVRRARGKPEAGQIRIIARQEGEFVFLTFADDGQGIDLREIHQALVRAGRMRTGENPPESELVSAIFEPGFSSRPTADALAGRGMGLNIVKNSLERLGGDITVEFAPAAFSRFHLSVPLTAAITQALLFKVGGQVYALAAAYVVQALPLGPDDLLIKDGWREAVALPGDAGTLPLLRLQPLLGADMAPGKRGAALQVRYRERSFVVTCDKVIGPRTIVVRPLGPLLGSLPLYAGVTVSGAGKAQLVLDPAVLADVAHAATRRPLPSPRRGLPRVLVVDDSRLAREAAARVLAGAGYQPITAEDGFDAWEMLNERRFDALVTDLEMPRLDGFELIELVRGEATLHRLPIVVVSSRSSAAIRERVLALGANALLAKSPNKRPLVDTVKGLLAAG